MIRSLALLALLAPLPALAAGGGSTPPAQTPTTAECPEGSVWDAERKACVAASSGALDDRQLFDAARELAYFDRADEALTMLGHVTARDADVLTLMGFATRRTGDRAGGEALYAAALALEPDHWLALSYWGQGLVEAGDRAGAAAKLERIRASGGRGTWAEIALATALTTGRGYSH